VYTLSGFVKVREGATLHIEPGTRIVGDTMVDGSSLWITRGGKIDAVGTVDKPIVFTSARAPGKRAPGDWGGIIVVGSAIDNRSAGGGQTTILTEGPPGSGQNTAENYAGGTNAADNSGTMKYVRIEFAGYAVQPDQELNALSMYTVGSGTDFQYIQAVSGLDDSFEWFGGSVDMSHLVSYEAGDDHFDWSEGFNGRVQYMIGMQSYRLTPRAGAGFSSVDPHAFEGDGCEADKAGCTSFLTAPISEPVFANFTLVGAGPNTFSFAGFKDANGAVIRRGSGGHFVNGIMTRSQGIGLDVRDIETDANRQAGTLTVTSVLFTENAGGNFDATAACNSSYTPGNSGGSCGTLANFPDAIDGGTTTARSLFAALPDAGVAPTTGTMDWSLSASSAARTGGTTTFAGRLADRVAGYKYGALTGTTFLGAADPAASKWWEGWTSYERN
jgi:hypothetical protein